MSRYRHVVNRLKAGDRVVMPKSEIGWIQHHAIYLGIHEGRHLFIENQTGFGVRVLTEAQLFNGVSEITRVERFIPRNGYGRNDLVRFALSKRGEAYSLLGYNCENFANQVQHRHSTSKQANNGLVLGGLAAIALVAFAGR